MKREKRTDEAQVYDVHSFIQRYMGALKEQNIPINKKQIGVLEQMLLAENSVPVKSKKERVDEGLLNEIVGEGEIKCYLTTINAIRNMAKVYHVGQYKEHGAYTNGDFLELYHHCMKNYPNIKYPLSFGPKKLSLLKLYLKQKGLLPPEQK